MGKFSRWIVHLSGLVLIAAGLMLGANPPAHGQGQDAVCSDYAIKAIGQVNAAQNMRCGYAGPRWSPDYNAHFEFCKRNIFTVADFEETARSQQMACCRYGAQAVDQVLRARQSRCGFTGPRWSELLHEHINWCNARPPGYARAECVQRDNDIARCTNRVLGRGPSPC